MNRLSPPFVLSWAVPILVLLSSPQATADATDWQGHGPAQVRLISAGVGEDGQFAAGIEIALEPGWHTYWRTPGDAGIAPLTDFSASVNVDDPITVAFPVPQRYDDGYSVSNVYKDHVVFLVEAKATDPQAPSTLSVSLDIGVCAEICIPEHYDLALELLPGAAADARAEAILASARKGLPGTPVSGVFDVDSVERAGGPDKKPTFEVSITAPQAAEAEVFVEGPIDWYPGPSKLVASEQSRATFSVVFSRYGSKTPIGGTIFRVTVLSADGAIEDTVKLD